MPVWFGSIPRAIAVRAVIMFSLAACTGAGALARGGAAGPNVHAPLSSNGPAARTER